MGRRSSYEKQKDLLELLEHPSFVPIGVRRLHEVLSIYECFPGATWRSMVGFLEVLPYFLENFDATPKSSDRSQGQVRPEVSQAGRAHEGR